ncbi:MAG: pentapeptide repeat-containing protein [Acidimicrobiia bacterium]|nr:pentapeptide repeat-containing protein [Acidimicrobiia bacterium]
MTSPTTLVAERQRLPGTTGPVATSPVALNFARASLDGARMTSMNLAQASFAGASLVGASLAGSDLSDANFSGANLYQASFRGTQRDGTIGVPTGTAGPCARTGPLLPTIPAHAKGILGTWVSRATEMIRGLAYLRECGSDFGAGRRVDVNSGRGAVTKP